MKNWLVLMGTMALFAFASSPIARAHDVGESRVDLELEPDAPVQAGNVTIVFQMIDLKRKTLIGDQDLVPTSEMKLHLFIFDPALREFRHVHPAFSETSDKRWSVQAQLSANGNYWVWAQGELADGREGFTASTRLEVRGGQPENPVPPALGDVRTGVDGISRVTLSETKTVAKQMTMLDARISRTDGTQPSPSPYLGEMAHATLVPSDGDSLIHVHPMSTGTPNQLMLHAEFPEPGYYRLWIQFIDGDILRTVPLSVAVFPR